MSNEEDSEKKQTLSNDVFETLFNENVKLVDAKFRPLNIGFFILAGKSDGTLAAAGNFPKEKAVALCLKYIENSVQKIDKNNFFEIVRERVYQIHKKGFTSEIDDSRADGELALAGACYAIHGANPLYEKMPPALWPQQPSEWKPKDIRRNLVRAAALILAELDKYDRQEKNTSQTTP